MIVQIVGSNGAGKSTAVRTLMDEEALEVTVVGPGKEPIGYNIALTDVSRTVHVVGPYQTPTGGCDRVKPVTEAFSRVLEAWRQDRHVIFEGVFVMNQTRGPELVKQLPPGSVVVLHLTTPLGVCLSSIDERRAEKGAEALPAHRKKNATDNHGRARSYAARMREAGAQIIRVSRDEVVREIHDLLIEEDLRNPA